MQEISFPVSNGRLTHRFGMIELGPITSGCKYLCGYGLTIPLKIVALPLALAPESPEVPHLVEIVGTFHAGAQQHLIAPLLPQVSFQCIRQWDKREVNNNLLLDVMLSQDQLSAIEEVRAQEGGDFSFGVKLRLRIDGTSPPPNVVLALTQRVALSEWVKVLKTTKYADRIVVEIPVGAEATDLQGVANGFRDAQNLFSHGRYTDCVISCRKVIEQLNAYVNRSGPIADGDHKPGRVKRIRDAVKNFTHPAAHSDAGPREWYEYDRHDAQFIMQVVAALMRHCDAPQKV